MKKRKKARSLSDYKGESSAHLGAAGKGGWGSTNGFNPVKTKKYKSHPIGGEY